MRSGSWALRLRWRTMPMGLLLFFANAFVLGYALDGSLSLVEGIFRLATGSDALLAARSLVAETVVLGSLAALPAMVLTPRLPASVIAPLALSALWMASGAAPLPLLLASPRLDSGLSGLQLAIAVLAFLRIRALSGGRSWLLGHELPQRPSFSIRHTLWSGAAVFFGGSVLLAVYAPFWLMSTFQVMTDGFVHFDLAGVSLADRSYERNGQEIRLVGMMHIGQEESYRSLVGSFSGPPAVILAEGVTDRQGLLPEPLSYEHAARALGLQTQDSMEDYFHELGAPQQGQWPDVRRADLDLSDFHPETIALLESATRIWGGQDPLRALGAVYVHCIEKQGDCALLGQDVLMRRNRHLVEEIGTALKQYDRVIVPWGAMHQPFIQSEILRQGFERTGGTYHLLASWRTVAAALSSRRPGRD